jgi:hydrogenase large subunit
MMAYIWKIKILQDFIDNVYIPDVLAVAGAYMDYAGIGVGCQNLLSYGSFDLDGSSPDYTRRERLFKQGTVSADLKPGDLDTGKITEYVKHSWYEDSTTNRHPSHGDTKPQYGKKDAYSWTKSPRYDGKVYEVGPLARVAVSYAKGITGRPLFRSRPPPGAGAFRQDYCRRAGGLGAAVEAGRTGLHRIRDSR